MPAERVAEAAVAALLAHRDSGAALEVHLADQVIAPLALASGRSTFTVERISRHLETNSWVIERFGLAQITLAPGAGTTGVVTLDPQPP